MPKIKLALFVPTSASEHLILSYAKGGAGFRRRKEVPKNVIKKWTNDDLVRIMATKAKVRGRASAFIKQVRREWVRRNPRLAKAIAFTYADMVN